MSLHPNTQNGMKEIHMVDTPVKTVATAFQIVELLKEEDEMGLTEISQHLSMAKSTIYRHLQTLQDLDLVVKEDHKYHIALRFIQLGEYARNRKAEYRMVEDKLNEVAAETNERAQFAVEEHERGVIVHRKTGKHAVQTDSSIGTSFELHTTSSGKVILAHLPEKYVQQIIDNRGLSKLTPNTITDRDQLFDELENIRNRGYSLNKEEHLPGLNAVSVPVKWSDGEIIGALGVSGPANRLKGRLLQEELPDLLLGTANELELNLAHLDL